MDAFKKLYKQYPKQSFSAGEIILHQGIAPEAAFVMGSGIVRAYNINHQGEEKPVAFERAGDILSSAWVFGRTDHSLFFYEAYTDCVVYKAPQSELLTAIHDSKEIMIYLMDRFIAANAAKALRLNALEHSRASEKVVHMLLYLSQAFGVRQHDGMWLIDLPLTQQQLGNLVGLTRETTSVEMHKLRKRGYVRMDGRRYIIDRARLSDGIGEEELDSFELVPSEN